MIGLYVKKARLTLNWKIEDENIKYRQLLDRILNSERNFNKLYNLIYIIAKILIVAAIMLDNVLMQ